MFGYMTEMRIPLVGGKTVVLAGEFPITAEQWDGLMNVLRTFKPGLIEEEPGEPTAEASSPEGLSEEGAHL